MQVVKADRAVAAKVPTERDKFIHLSGSTMSVNHGLDKEPVGKVHYVLVYSDEHLQADSH